jgi:hypothetical protein
MKNLTWKSPENSVCYIAMIVTPTSPCRQKFGEFCGIRHFENRDNVYSMSVTQKVNIIFPYPKSGASTPHPLEPLCLLSLFSD